MAATLEYDYVSRGILSDLKFAMYRTGGTVRSYYSKYTLEDFFDDAPTLNDAFYIQTNAIFDGVRFSGITGITSTSHTLTWEYWDGSAWSALSVTDGTSGLTVDGDITFTPPTDWRTNCRSYNLRITSGGEFLVRARLTAFTDFTEGGNLSSTYSLVRQKYIHINDSGSHTPASLYADDVSNGWGVIEQKGISEYQINCGLYLNTCTFNIDSCTLQVGGGGIDKYYPFKMYATTFNTNIPTDGQLLPATSSDLTIFTRGTAGTIIFYPKVGSKINNLMLRLPSDYNYRRFALGSYGDNGIDQVEWFNVFFEGLMYSIGSHYFKRINFEGIQYLLSNGVTEYDNCYFRTSFSVDSDYSPIITRPQIDGRYATYKWKNSIMQSNIARQQHMDVISGTWRAGNKYVHGTDTQSGTDNGKGYVQNYSNYLNIKVFDMDGNALSGVTLTVTDQDGYNGLWEETDLRFQYLPDNPNDTNNWRVTDPSTISVDDEYLHWGEVFKVNTITLPYTLDVDRGLEGGHHAYSFRDYYSPIRKRVASMTIDESKDEIYVMQRSYYKYSVDGGTTSTGNVMKEFNPYTITLSKDGYATFSAVMNITDETDLNVVLKTSPKFTLSTDGSVSKYLDPDNPKNLGLVLPL